MKGVGGNTRGMGFRLGGRGSGFQAKLQSARTSIVGGGKSTLEGPEMEKSGELYKGFLWLLLLPMSPDSHATSVRTGRVRGKARRPGGGDAGGLGERGGGP